MAQSNREYKVLSSKKLTQSFKKLSDTNSWESMFLTKRELEDLLLSSLDKLNHNSNPLTITITMKSKND